MDTGSRVRIFVLGGTISMRGGSEGLRPDLTGEDLVATVPGLADVAEIDVVATQPRPSAELDVEEIVALAGRIATWFDEGGDGAVVVQGTDTLDEVAFLLSALVDAPQPVVVTGAMRGADQPSADGTANLLAAVQTAAGATGIGTVVVMGDVIHPGRYVHKSHTALPSAFTSAPGPLGWVVEGRPHVLLRPTPRAPLPSEAVRTGVRVAIVGAPLGDDGALLEAAAGYDGVVLEAPGGGHVPAATAEVAGRLARRMPVVLASRTGSGPVLRRTYGFPGSERDLLERGLVPAGHLDARQSRLVLTLLLRAGHDLERIRAEAERWFV